jgi:C4-type Zn-finger protein
VEWRCPTCHEALMVPLMRKIDVPFMDELVNLSCMIFMDEIYIQDAAQAMRTADDLSQLHKA